MFFDKKEQPQLTKADFEECVETAFAAQVLNVFEHPCFHESLSGLSLVRFESNTS